MKHSTLHINTSYYTDNPRKDMGNWSGKEIQIIVDGAIVAHGTVHSSNCSVENFSENSAKVEEEYVVAFDLSD